ncbi:S-adenosyl-L-methionine-dependent methyltransferase [Russula earlei]|uniref:S-adenosyl-L-methionine-dependent methyltransferase n=1 Tax=Russula earlei TaxID=71964 RepID=A0ACC0UBF2_9AGAM|nr:S-adenosyl-L-methionine-dependent methyltransferase [Russula earlei]
MSTFLADPQSQPQPNPGPPLQAPIDTTGRQQTPPALDRNRVHVHGRGDQLQLHQQHQHSHPSPSPTPSSPPPPPPAPPAPAAAGAPEPPPTPKQRDALLEAANVAFFDALSHDFDARHPDAADLADRLSRALRRVLVLDDDATSVLDYACGSGQVSRALAPHVAQLVGVDISPRMVEVYNARANAQGLEPHEMRAVGSLAELQQARFDVAVCSMAYHHIPSVQDVTRELVAYLKPSGTLAVADIARVEEDEGEPPIMAKYEHIVAHTRGFAERDMRALFEGAGLQNVAFERFTTSKKEGRDVQLFLATGTKPASS